MGNKDYIWVFFFTETMTVNLRLVISLTPNLQKSTHVSMLCKLQSFAFLRVCTSSGDLKFQEIVLNFRIRYHFRKFTCEFWKQLTDLYSFCIIWVCP